MQPSDPKSTDPKPPRWFAHLPEFPHWLSWSFYFLIVYVLSGGPVALLRSHHVLPPAVDSFIRAFYFPIAWLIERSATFEAFFMWYIHQVWGATAH